MPKSSSYPDLERKPGKQNWVDKAGGLPSYIERIAKHLHYEEGMTIGHAIASAVNTVKRWCKGGTVSKTGGPEGGQNVTAATKAKACVALTQWNAKRTSLSLSLGLDRDAATDADLVAAIENRVELQWLLDQSQTPLDQSAYALALSQCRADVGLLDVDGQVGYNLNMSVFKWREHEHPRNFLGRFTKKLESMESGGKLTIPGGMTVTKTGDRYRVGIGEVQSPTTYKKPESAAKKALDYSAASTDPESLGGKESHGGASNLLDGMEWDQFNDHGRFHVVHDTSDGTIEVDDVTGDNENDAVVWSAKATRNEDGTWAIDVNGEDTGQDYEHAGNARDALQSLMDDRVSAKSTNKRDTRPDSRTRGVRQAKRQDDMEISESPDVVARKEVENQIGDSYTTQIRNKNGELRIVPMSPRARHLLQSDLQDTPGKITINRPEPAELAQEFDADPDDFQSIGELSPKLQERIDELEATLKEGAVVTLHRNWEGIAVVNIEGDDRLSTLYLTDEGKVGYGGVNQPEYHNTIAEYLKVGVGEPRGKQESPTEVRNAITKNFPEPLDLKMHDAEGKDRSDPPSWSWTTPDNTEWSLDYLGDDDEDEPSYEWAVSKMPVMTHKSFLTEAPTAEEALQRAVAEDWDAW